MARRRTTYLRVKNIDNIRDLRADSSFPEIVTFYRKYCFYELFRAEIAKRLEERYSAFDSQAIMNAIDNNLINITNRETFFTYPFPMEDSDLITFNSVLDLDEYIRTVIYSVKYHMELGASRIVLTSFLLNVALFLDMADKNKINIDRVYSLIESFLYSVVCFKDTVKDSCPVVFRILNSDFLRIRKDYYGVTPEKYIVAVRLFFSIYEKLKVTSQVQYLMLPRIEFLKSVYTKEEVSLYRRLSRVLEIPADKIREILDGINVFVPSTELKVAFDRLGEMSPKGDAAAELALYYAALSPDVKLSSAVSSEDDEWMNSFEFSKYESNNNITNVYTDIDFFKLSEEGAFSVIEINCINIGLFEELEPLLEYAYKLSMIRHECVRGVYKEWRTFKITLKNVPMYNRDFKVKLLQKMERMRTNSQKRIVFEVNYRYVTVAYKKSDFSNKVRIMSDIHEDVNESQGFHFNFGNTFIVNCGDTSGDVYRTISWINSNMDRGVFVHGNHLGYSSDLPLNDSIKLLEETFGEGSRVRYLNNSSYEYNGVVFIGCCLYTDFKLYGEENQEKAMNYAQMSMNDFRYPKYRDEDGTIRRLTPADYVRFHQESKLFLYQETLKYLDKPVVIVTHFAPMEQSVSEKYKGSPLNPAFASDMRDLIDARPNIKMWVHGHMHSKAKYTYKGAKILCYPVGYYNEMTLSYDDINLFYNTNFDKIKNIKRTK